MADENICRKKKSEDFKGGEGVYIMKTIAIGCDHGGFELKEELKKRLTEAGYTVADKGIETLHSVDYPDIAVKVAHTVTEGETECGILICGTGIGMSIAANKVRGIRAALCSDCYSARMTKEHNDANIITLGARTIGVELAWEIVKAYLGAEFQGGRHAKRVEKIHQIEAEG